MNREQSAASAGVKRCHAKKNTKTEKNQTLSPMNNIRLSISARAALLAAGASFALPVIAATPIGPAAATAVAEQPAEAAPAAPEDQEEDDEYSEDEIIVTAPRLAGQLATDIRAEAELDEAAVASYGASSIEELLDALETMPPSSGVALGFDRLVMLATRAPSLSDVLWTPAL